MGEPSGPEPRRRRSRWMVAGLAGGIAVVMVAAGLAGTRILGVWGPEPAVEPEPTLTSTPTEAPVASPFAGTPAENFAEGEAGMVLPEAEAIGEFTADEVADALEQVRDALIAARLDHQVLVDHELDPFLELMASDHQVALRAAIDEHALGPFPTVIAPGAMLAPELPRVDGTISYEISTAGARDTSILQVITRFAWVYPFEDELVVVRDELVWEIRLGRPWLESSQGRWLGEGSSSVAWGVDCDAYEEGMLRPAPWPDELVAEIDMIFDSDQPLEPDNGC